THLHAFLHGAHHGTDVSRGAGSHATRSFGSTHLAGEAHLGRGTWGCSAWRFFTRFAFVFKSGFDVVVEALPVNLGRLNAQLGVGRHGQEVLNVRLVHNDGQGDRHAANLLGNGQVAFFFEAVLSLVGAATPAAKASSAHLAHHFPHALHPR